MVVPTVPVPVAVIARQRRYIAVFREHGATSPDRAVTLAELGTGKSHIFRRLVAAGVFVAMPGDRYYLSERGAEDFRQRQAQRVVWMLAGVTMALVVALLILWTVR